MIKLLLVLLVVFSLASCKQKTESVFYKDGISEGIIEFSVSYPYLDSNDLALKMLPNKMEMTFKDNIYKIESVGGMGFFICGYISNNDKKEMDNYLKIISSKFVSRFNEKGVKKLHEDFPSFRLEKLDSTKEVAGYTCEGYRVIFYSNVVQDHSIWFTTDIKVHDANWCTPFPQVNGILMEYQIQRNGLVIDFKANKIISDSLDINEFNVPLNYKVISNKALIRKMEEVFGGFEY